MPRVKREKSESGVYHIMVRGIDKMSIFLDPEDHYRYIDTLHVHLEKSDYELYAFCLMHNHLHLLIKEVSTPVSLLMKGVGVSYAYYFNQKYGRVGHLFQGRYRSEVIDSEFYFLGCSRYIHNNPVVAGLVSMPEEYPWSSYKTYLGSPQWKKLLDLDTLLTYLANDLAKAVLRLQDFTTASNEDAFLEYEAEYRSPVLPRAHWDKFLAELLGRHDITLEQLKSTPDIDRRNIIIREIKSGSNLPVRELAELLGFKKDVIFRA